MQIEGYEVTFMQAADREGKFQATVKANKYASAFMRAYLVKKLQFNNIVLLRNKVPHGSLVISMDKLKSSRNVKLLIDARRRLPIRHS